MNFNDFNVSAVRAPHRGVSRGTGSHGVMAVVLGVVCVAALFGLLGILYTLG